MISTLRKSVLAAFVACTLATNAYAYDGSRLWLGTTGSANAQITLTAKSTATTDIAKRELAAAWKGAPVSLVVKKVKGMKRDAYTIKIKEGKVTITSPSDIGLLYGAYRLLQFQTMNATSGDVEVSESPFHDIRLLNHWDNLDGNSERGYAGKSIFWNVKGFPKSLGNNDVNDIKNCPLGNDTYARACASAKVWV